MQGGLDMTCTALSLGLQGRCDVETAVRHLIGNQTPPLGVVGQPRSAYDGVGRLLRATLEGENETGAGDA